MLRLLLVLIVFCCFLADADAQYYKKRTSFSPTITLGGFSTPNAAFTDTTGNYNTTDLNAGIILPIDGRIWIKEKGDKPQLFHFFANGGIRLGMPSIDWFTYQRSMVNASMGLTGLYYYGKKNTLAAGIYGFIAEDAYTFRDPEARYAGFLLYNKVWDSGLIFKGGLFYTYTFGRGILLPIIGLGYDFTERTGINLTLPVKLSFRYTPNKNHEFRMFIMPRGGFNNINNLGGDIGFQGGQLPEMQMRRTEFRTGVEGRFKLTKDFLLKLEMGILSDRSLSFYYLASNSTESIYSAPIENAGYLQASVSFKIKYRHKENDEMPDLDNIDIDRPYRSDIEDVVNESTKKQKRDELEELDLSDIDLDQLDLMDLDLDELDLDEITIDDIDVDDIELEDLDVD